MRRAVRYGDFWHPTRISPQELRQEVAYLKEYSATVGREAPPQLSLRANLSFTTSSPERLPLQGNAEDIITDIQDYAAAGVSHIIMEIPGNSYPDKFKAMERFLEEVRPHAPA